MATNFVQPGNSVDLTAPAAINSGDFVVVGDLFGVAAHGAASSQPLTVHLGGVWSFPGITGAAGVGVYHDGSSLTTADGGGANAKAGVLLGDGQVRLNSDF